MLAQVIVFRPDQRPPVEVLIRGVWLHGELRAWFPVPDGWRANVSYSTGPGETRLETVPAECVRPVAHPSRR